jgi:hypothetical protein
VKFKEGQNKLVEFLDDKNVPGGSAIIHKKEMLFSSFILRHGY